MFDATDSRSGPAQLSEPLERLLITIGSPKQEKRAREHEAYQQAREREEQEVPRKAWEAARGRRYLGCTLDNFHVTLPEQQEVLTAIRQYAAGLDANIEAGRNVLLVGPPGTGKDHLVAALSRLAFAGGHVLRWTSGPRLFSKLYDRMKSGGEGELIDWLARAPILALSDPVCPDGRLTDWQQTKVYDLIDRRYSNSRATWVTLNADNREDAERRIGRATIDRLREGALSLACNWPSHRRP